MNWNGINLERVRTDLFKYLSVAHDIYKYVTRTRMLTAYFAFLSIIILLSIFGPLLAPYGATDVVYGPDDGIKTNAEPSISNPLGTTTAGYDVLSRLLIGARPTMITGLLGGTIIISIGTSIGVISGYVGGLVDNSLMRITDFIYGVPLIPFAIVLVGVLGIGYFTSILVIGAILWRASARVLRSQVLQIKERPYILSAQATGGGTIHIITTHVLPNIAPMIVLFFALGMGASILIQAGLTFVGVVDPFTPSWGVMIRNAYSAGRVADAWYWSIPPGLLISFTVLSAFMFGREFESTTGTGIGSDRGMAEGGV